MMPNMAHVRSAKVRPSASSCGAMPPADGSANCGRYARKKTAILGLRTFEVTRHYRKAP
jgi:hypothetical protein